MQYIFQQWNWVTSAHLNDQMTPIWPELVNRGTLYNYVKSALQPHIKHNALVHTYFLAINSFVSEWSESSQTLCRMYKFYISLLNFTIWHSYVRYLMCNILSARVVIFLTGLSYQTPQSVIIRNICTTDQMCTCVVVGIEIHLNFKTHLCWSKD